MTTKPNKEIELTLLKDSFKKDYKTLSTCEDRELIYSYLAFNGALLQHVHNRFKKDPLAVTIATDNDHNALLFADKDLRDDKTLVLRIVQRNGWAIQYASERLQLDKDVALASLRSGTDTRLIHPSLLNNHDIATAALQSNAFVFRTLPDALKKDLTILKTAIQQDVAILNYADSSTLNNFSVMKQLIQVDFRCGRFASNELLDNKKFILDAIKVTPRSLAFASPHLKNDPEVILQAIIKDRFAITHASEEILEVVKDMSHAEILCFVQNRAERQKLLEQNKDTLSKAKNHQAL